MLQLVSGGSAYGARLITNEPFRRGQVIYHISGHRVTEAPTYQTIQVGRSTHIEELGVIAYLNHSCQPNTLIAVARLDVLAARDITAGEELNFFYPSTEWEMDRPFICLCGAPQCVRLVAGAKYLSIDTLSRYFINPHIREMIFETLAQTAEVDWRPTGVR
jgi:hypothetical protein